MWDVFERVGFSGECRGRDDFGRFDSNEVSHDSLACYDRLRDDYTVASRSIVARRTVKNLEGCARLCDERRDNGRTLDCHAFSFR